MLVVSDIDEVFVPLRGGLFVKPAERRAAVESLLTALPERFATMARVNTALGSALRAGLAALVRILLITVLYAVLSSLRLDVVAM